MISVPLLECFSLSVLACVSVVVFFSPTDARGLVHSCLIDGTPVAHFLAALKPQLPSSSLPVHHSSHGIILAISQPDPSPFLLPPACCFPAYSVPELSLPRPPVAFESPLGQQLKCYALTATTRV